MIEVNNNLYCLHQQGRESPLFMALITALKIKGLIFINSFNTTVTIQYILKYECRLLICMETKTDQQR